MTHQNLKIIIALLIILVTIKGICFAQSREVKISGKIITTGKKQGHIIVFLVDKKSFNKPLSGIDTIIVTPRSNTISFSFYPKEQGVYGIRCFQDLNNNGILDKGVFGPVEPYGFSWQNGKRFPVSFSDISFTVNSNKQVTIKMED